MLAAELLGCAVHALLFTLVHAGWLGLLGPIRGTGASLALLTSVTVVVGLSALWPGLPWWALALLSPPPEGERRAAAPAVTSRLGRLLSEDRSARSHAFRAALALHAMFAVPTLGVVLALLLGGLVWVALVVMLLLSASLTRAVGRQVMRHYPRAALQRTEGEPPSRGVARVMTGLALSTATLGVGAGLLVGAPAPTILGGTCVAGANETLVALPGALPGTPLFMEVSADAITLSAEDGGGPGRIPLATCSALTCGEVPTRAVVENDDGVLVVTLCAGENAAATPQQLQLATRGYRLDDGIARRVLRSPWSVGLALAVLLLGFAYSRWGFGALLRWSAPEGTEEARAGGERAAVLWALALGGAQLAWLLVTWLGP